MSEWVQPEVREVHTLLVNWGRWAITRPHYGHCGSAEYQYRSPQCWYPPEPKGPEPELEKAVAIERQMRHISKKHRLALKFRYVYRADPKWACRRLHLRYDLWEELIYHAQLMVYNRIKSLTLSNSQPIIQTQQFGIPPPGETTAPSGAVFA